MNHLVLGFVIIMVVIAVTGSYTNRLRAECKKTYATAVPTRTADEINKICQ